MTCNKYYNAKFKIRHINDEAKNNNITTTTK